VQRALRSSVPARRPGPDGCGWRARSSAHAKTLRGVPKRHRSPIRATPRRSSATMLRTPPFAPLPGSRQCATTPPRSLPCSPTAP
jgi:hypothetical protein